MIGITISTGTINDVEAIADFQVAMAQESEGTTLQMDTLLQGVQSVMEDENKGTYIVVRKDGEPVGSLLLTREWSDWNNAWYWWIQSVYVAPAFRRQGVYRSMYQYVKQLAKENGVAQVRLYVDKTNQRGLCTYQALGMHESHYLLYEEDL